MNWRTQKIFERNLFPVCLALALIGNVMIYSATSHQQGSGYLLTRGVHLALGMLAFVVASRVRYTAWRRMAPMLYALVLILLVLVLIPGIGIESGGARRWLYVGFFGLQPSEFAKLASILLLGCAVTRVRPGSGPRAIVRPLGGVGLLLALVLLEPDFGTSVIIVAGVAGVLWASELRTANLLLSGGLASAVLTGIMLLEPYRRERILAFLDPRSVAHSSGYQVTQSVEAIRSGGVFGLGVGRGAESATVPEAHTDMVFSLVGQELGLLGTIGVIVALAYVALRGYRIALSAPSVLGRCISAGIATMFATQSVFNVGAAMAILPLTGITLPFVSHGGSSLLVCFASVGILHRIAKDGQRVGLARGRGGSRRTQKRRRSGPRPEPLRQRIS
jgi:cell division protein FtsW